jgi:hypothetical protein
MILTILFENNTNGRCIAANHSIAALAWRHEVVMHQMHLSYLSCCHWPIQPRHTAGHIFHLGCQGALFVVCFLTLLVLEPLRQAGNRHHDLVEKRRLQSSYEYYVWQQIMQLTQMTQMTLLRPIPEIPTSPSKQLQLKALLHCESIALVLGVSETVHCLKHLGGFGASNWKDRSWMIMIDSDSQLLPIALVSL